MMIAADRGRWSVSDLRYEASASLQCGHIAGPNQVFVSPDEGIAYSGDIGFIQLVHSLTSTL